MTNSADRSNGYEDVAEAFIRVRNPQIGTDVVREWSATLPPRASVLDLGCGNGIPISRELMNHGFSVSGIDASAKLVAEFRRNFPSYPAEFAAVEESTFFNRKFDATIAWGLMFLLAPATQERVIEKVAIALSFGGQFLFT